MSKSKLLTFSEIAKNHSKNYDQVYETVKKLGIKLVTRTQGERTLYQVDDSGMKQLLSHWNDKNGNSKKSKKVSKGKKKG